MGWKILYTIVYLVCTTAKCLWNLLEKRYKIKNARTKKFVISKFLDFKIVDSKTVMS